MKIVLVSYFYPPQRGIGGKRIFRWAKELASRGFSPVVLTTPTPPEKEIDAGQETESEGVWVLRSYCPEWLWRLYYRTNEGVRAQVDAPSSPSVSSVWLARLEAWVHRYYPLDPKIWFAPFAAVEVLRWIRQEKPDAALVTAAPVSSFLVGLVIGATKLPWVADFRDPWSFNFEQQKKAPLMQWIEFLLESRVLHSATRVIFASDNTRNKYALLYPHMAEKFVTLYSGFEPYSERVSNQPRTPGKIQWVHFGTFYGPRKLGVFVDALAKVLEEKQWSPEQFQLLLLGNAAEADLTRARELGIESFIEVRGMLPYQAGIEILRGADTLLYCDPGREPYFVAGKFFDYLRAERPMFALSASSEINALLEKHQLGISCDPDDLVSMQEKIKKALDASVYAPVDVAALSAARSAEKLAELLIEMHTPGQG